MRGLLLVLAFVMLCATPARAGHVTFGSDLKADATLKRSAPVDSVYWNAKLAGGRRVRVPRRGQIVGMKLKGRINPAGSTPPDVVMHLQSLRPIGAGKTKVDLTTGNLELPFGGDPNRVTSYDASDIVNLCVHKGDSIGLSTSGGFGAGYANGAEFAVFGAVGGSAIKQFSGAGKDNNGSVFKGRERRGTELLMQLRLATGKAAGFCA